MARGDGRTYQRGAWKWVCYYHNGKQHREPAKGKDGRNTNDLNEAQKFLKSKTNAITTEKGGGPTFLTPAMRRITVHDLLEALKTQFELNGQASPQNLSHLRRADKGLKNTADKGFGNHLAAGLKSKAVEDYKKERLAAGDRPASINRPLQMIRQAYLLAVRSETLTRMPYIKLLSEKGNARKGFCEDSDFRRIYHYLPEYLKDFALFGYCTGMRSGEIKSLRWEYVRGDVIELQAEDAKGDGGEENARLIPMVGKDLAGILARRKVARQIKVGDTTRLAGLMFHRNGKPVGDFRRAWATACVAAGVGKMVCPKCETEGTSHRCPCCKVETDYRGRIFHDFRRTAVKTMDEAGVSRDVAMSISGHRTQSIYSRYNITDVKRQRTALERVQEFREAAARELAESAQEQRVVTMR